MTSVTSYYELANFTYYFFQLISLEILVSTVFMIDEHNNIRLRFERGTHQFKKTSFFVGIVILLAVGSYYLDKQFSTLIIELLASFDYKLMALSVAAISFFAFYLSKVVLSRRWHLPFTYITLSIFVISIGTFGYMQYIQL